MNSWDSYAFLWVLWDSLHLQFVGSVFPQKTVSRQPVCSGRMPWVSVYMEKERFTNHVQTTMGLSQEDSDSMWETMCQDPTIEKRMLQEKIYLLVWIDVPHWSTHAEW